MYSRQSWGGQVNPFILTKFITPESIPNGTDPIVSLVVFEWKDKDLIGKSMGPDGMEVSNGKTLMVEKTHAADQTYRGLHTSVTR